MASKRAKSNRGRFFGRRCGKTVQLRGADEIGAIDPRASRESACKFLDLEMFDDSRNQKPAEANIKAAYAGFDG
jgi:hypothetical protein